MSRASGHVFNLRGVRSLHELRRFGTGLGSLKSLGQPALCALVGDHENLECRRKQSRQTKDIWQPLLEAKLASAFPSAYTPVAQRSERCRVLARKARLIISSIRSDEPRTSVPKYKLDGGDV